jgi:AhpD family alkylhydroperoxidase
MFTIHTERSAPEPSREALGGIRQHIGFIPNLAATIAESPIALQAFGAMQASLQASTLSQVEREVVGLAVSFENDCPYSMAAHSTFAAGAGAAPAVVAALRTGEPVPDERLERLRAFATALLRTGGHVEDRHGLSDQEQLEVATQVAYTTLANLVANLGDTPVDGPFAEQAWDVPATLEASG